jgi:hypothetical protein
MTQFKLPKYHAVHFDPPLVLNSPEFKRAEEILRIMDVKKTTLIGTMGEGHMWLLGFADKDQAMMFRLQF